MGSDCINSRSLLIFLLCAALLQLNQCNNREIIIINQVRFAVQKQRPGAIFMKQRLGSRKTGLSPPPFFFNSDRSKAVLLLWFLTVTCYCCPYLNFGSAIVLLIYFVNFR